MPHPCTGGLRLQTRYDELSFCFRFAAWRERASLGIKALQRLLHATPYDGYTIVEQNRASINLSLTYRQLSCLAMFLNDLNLFAIA